MVRRFEMVLAPSCVRGWLRVLPAALTAGIISAFTRPWVAGWSLGPSPGVARSICRTRVGPGTLRGLARLI